MNSPRAAAAAMSRALQLGTRKADGNNIPFDLPLSTQNGGTGSTTGVSRASLGLATTDTVVFGALQPTTPLAAIYGGTGFSSFTIGAVPYGKTPTTLDWLLPNTTTTPYYYTSTGTGVAGQPPALKTPTQMRTDLSLATTSNVVFNSLDVKAGGIRTPSCNYRKKSDQSINTSTFTAITFSNGTASSYGEWDNNNWHPSSDSTFTSPSGFSTGVFNVSGNVCFDTNATGSRQVAIYMSGTGQYNYVIVPACSANYTIVPFSFNMRVSSSSNTFTLYAWQDSGGALNVKGASTEGYTNLSIVCVSASN